MLALFLTVVVVEADPLANAFQLMTLKVEAVIAAIFLAFLIIPIIEVYKAIMRAVEKEA